MTPAETIRTARIDADLSQRELAKAVGCRQADISDMENGKGVLFHAGERLVAVCMALDLDPATLFRV